MNRRDDELDRALDRALSEIRGQAPDQTFEQAATDRVWQRLHEEVEGSGASAIGVGQIRSCEDFQSLIPDYVRGRLPQARHLLVKDHVGECVPCRRALKRVQGGSKPIAVREGALAPSRWSKAGWRMAAAAVIFLAVVGINLETDVFSFESGGVIRIESAEGEVFRVTDEGTEPLAVGDQVTLEPGEAIRTAKDSTAMLALADASMLEMRERSELAVRQQRFLLPGRRSNGIVDLERGSVIIEASDQGSGHLYVDTEDCRVGVTGTVFSVSHGMKGSRVSVIEGEVQVDYQGSRAQDVLLPGQQATTNPALRKVPVEHEIAWSQNSAQYLALLEEMRVLGREIDQALRPGLRFSTTLLDLAPADTVVYVAMPNISEELGQAYEILQQRVATSAVLADWWDQQVRQMGVEGHLEQVIEKVRRYGDHLGDEILMTLQIGMDGEVKGPLFLAEITSPDAFVDMLTEEMADLERAYDADLHLHLIEGPLPVVAPDRRHQLFFWIQDGVLSMTPDFDDLRVVEAALLGDDRTKLAGTAFHSRLKDLYAEGVEWAVGVDLERLIPAKGHDREEMERLGLGDVQHVIAERKQQDDRTENRAVLTFGQPRRALASWLAEPAPMGAMDYISPDANLAVGLVMKDLGVLVNELFGFIGEDDAEFTEHLAEFERTQGIDIREDIANPLGGEFALALDGPLLPTPAWKLIMEVYDPERLVSSLEWMIDQVNRHVGPDQRALLLERESIRGREYFRIESLETGLSAYFVFDGGYLVAGPTSALIDRTLQNRAMGIKLIDSPSFLERLPQDSQVDFSGVFYQNLAPILGPLSQAVGGTVDMSDEDRRMLDALAAETKPMVALLYGEEDRIIFSSTSEGGLISSGLNSLTGFGNLLGMQQSVARAVGQIGAGEGRTHVKHEVRIE